MLKRVVVWGNMMSDKTDEQYPTITMCSDCIELEEAKKEESKIVSIGGAADEDDGDCEWGCA